MSIYLINFKGFIFALVKLKYISFVVRYAKSFKIENFKSDDLNSGINYLYFSLNINLKNWHTFEYDEGMELMAIFSKVCRQNLSSLWNLSV